MNCSTEGGGGVVGARDRWIFLSFVAEDKMLKHLGGFESTPEKMTERAVSESRALWDVGCV